MRYHEIVGPSPVVRGDPLLEGFLDSVARFLGNKVNEKIRVVANTRQAMTVIFKVCSNPQYSEAATFLLKKNLRQSWRELPDGPIKRQVEQRWPRGRTGNDFLKALVLTCVVNARLKAGQLATGQVADQAGDLAKDASVALARKLVNLDGLLATALSSPAGIFAVFKTLEIADMILFQTLSAIAQKLATAKLVTA